MYLIYVDESGDPGNNTSGTEFFVISGIIIHELVWNDMFQKIMRFRRNLAQQYHISQRIPFHAIDIVNGHGDFHFSQSGLTINQRFDIYCRAIDLHSQSPQIRILNIFIRKDRIIPGTPVDIFETGWRNFIQRFHNFLDKGGLMVNLNDYGLLITDRTHDDQLRRLLRKMRAFNPVPSQVQPGSTRSVLATRILDDPMPKPSVHSYFIQMADLVAFSLARRDYPRTKLQRHGFQTYFDMLNPVLLTQACQYDSQGIVYWPR